MAATLHRLPGAGSHLLTKQELATHFGRSPRWIEIRVSRGMPSENLDRYGRRMFDLRAVEAWLAAGEPRATSTSERLALLEREVAELRATIERMGGGR